MPVPPRVMGTGPKNRMGPAQSKTVQLSAKNIAEAATARVQEMTRANRIESVILRKGEDNTGPKGRRLPDKERAEKGLSVASLWKKQPAYLKNSAEDIVIKTLKATKTKSGLPAYTGLAKKIDPRPQRLHKYVIIGLDSNKISMVKQSRIKVSCSCEFFMYNSEYALWTWGAANIGYSNGEPAKITNPANYPILCIHLAGMLKEIAAKSL